MAARTHGLEDQAPLSSTSSGRTPAAAVPSPARREPGETVEMTKATTTEEWEFAHGWDLSPEERSARARRAAVAAHGERATSFLAERGAERA